MRWLPALAWATLIFALSSLPGAALPKELASALPSGVDVLAHLGLFSVLGALVGLALAPSRYAAWTAAFLACSLYGLSDEVHQVFVAGRFFEVTDLLMDALGAAAGLALAAAFLRKRRRRRPSQPDCT